MIGNERSDSGSISGNWARVGLSMALLVLVIVLIDGVTEKRAAAQRAETDFFNLLKERNLTSSDLVWKDVQDFVAQTGSMTHLIYLNSRLSAEYQMIHAMMLLDLLLYVKSYSTRF